MDKLGLERRERDGHGRGHRRVEGRQGHGHRDRRRRERVRRGHGRGRREAADDGVVQAGFLVEDREGELQGALHPPVRRPRRRAEGRVRRMVQAHRSGHQGSGGVHRVHERFQVGLQRRQELHRLRNGHGGLGRQDIVQGSGLPGRETDDGVVQAGFLVEDREGELQGALHPPVRRPRRRAEGRVRRMVQAHRSGHQGSGGVHRVHERFQVGLQRRQELHRGRRLDGRVRWASRFRRHTKLHHQR